VDVNASPLAPFLKEAGFTAGLRGYLKRAPSAPPSLELPDEDDA